MLKDPSEAKNLEELAEALTPERQKFLSLLSEKKWFRKTAFEIQRKALTVPFDFDGYLADLSARRDIYGGMDVLRLLNVQRGNYFAVNIFEVRSHQTNQVFTYEYVCQKFGRNPGYRGLILLEVAGEIKYFVLRRTEKFAVGIEVDETIGNFVQFKNNQLINLPKDVEKAFAEQLGLKDLVIKRFIDLGLIMPDPAMTSHSTALFAAVIAIDNLPALEKLQGKVFHTKPLEFKLIVEPIENLREYVHKVDESFFLASVLRLTSMGIVKL